MDRSTILFVVIFAVIAGIVLIYGLVLPLLAPIIPVWLNFFVVLLAPVSEPPMSAIFIVGLSLSLNLITQLANRLLIDQDRRKRSQMEIQKHQALVQKAKKTGSKKLQIRVQRRQKYIQKLQSGMAKSQFRPMLYYLIPFFIFFQILNGVYNPGGIAQIVAYFPFNIAILIPGFFRGALGVYVEGLGFGMYFLWWYMMVGFSLSAFMGKIFGTAPPELDTLETE
ncbi:MAG: EMC3/TMCO1 family protein [Candidatus Ranarchaeia archaeon]|jgi:uncharacterized membrane protein (DUF106 family)